MKMSRVSQKGITLVETLVAIAVMLIVVQGFTLVFLRSWQTNHFIIEEGLASAKASRATNALVSELRRIRQADNGDFPIESADDFDLKVYLDIDNDGVTERVHYFLENQELKRGVTNPVASLPPTYPAADDSVSTIADYVVNENDQPIFFYYNNNYPGDEENNPLVTPAPAGDIRLIGIRLYVNIDPVKAPDNINIESFVHLRNLTNYDD